MKTFSRREAFGLPTLGFGIAVRWACGPRDPRPSPHRELVRRLLQGRPGAKLFERTMYVFADPHADGLPPWPPEEVPLAIAEAHELLRTWPDRERSTRHYCLVVSKGSGQGFGVAPWASLARELRFESPASRDAVLRALALFAGSPEARGVGSIVFFATPCLLGEVLARQAFPSLKRLDLVHTSEPDLAALYELPGAGALEHLRLCNQREVRPSLVAAVLDGPAGRSLRSLCLESLCGSSDALRALLSRRALLPRLRRLGLFCNRLDDRDAEALVSATELCNLATLEVRLNEGITAAGREALARAPQFRATKLTF